MARLRLLAAQVLPLVFAILSIAFSLKYTTAKDWSHRHFYDAHDLDTDWVTPQYTQYRSPFIICSADAVPVNGTNGTVTTAYVQRCLQFSARRHRTSCELPAVTQNDSLAQTGDRRLCQQIHYAGNLAIAGTTFIGLGFLLTLGMAVLAGVRALSPATAHAHAHTATPKTDRDVAPSDAPSPPNHRHAHALPPYVNLTLMLFLTVGAVLTVLAQFYGVLAFTMSAADNGQWANVKGGSQNQRGRNHEPWVQGSALTTFASLTWLCAALGAAGAGLVWRLPRVERVL